MWYSAGGVVLLAQRGKIKVENTLDSRLEMMCEKVRRVLCPVIFVIYFYILLFHNENELQLLQTINDSHFRCVLNNMNFQKESYFSKAVVLSAAWFSRDYHL